MSEDKPGQRRWRISSPDIPPTPLSLSKRRGPGLATTLPHAKIRYVQYTYRHETEPRRRAPCHEESRRAPGARDGEVEMMEESTQHMTLTLADGTVVSVREVEPEDASALQRLFSRLSERTVYLRYFGPKNELSDEKAHHIADVDGTDRYALVALDPE